MEQLVPLILLLPLLGGLINGVLGKKLPKKVVGSLATAVMFIAFGIALNVFFQLHDSVRIDLFTIIRLDSFSLNARFLVDDLSIWMTLIVTGIGSLIHLFSMGYMSHDEGYYKFFTYLNLFIFAMLILILGSNYFMLFFGWEGVGICSYLLIGFHYSDEKKGLLNSIAARKAFVMNRIGDLGLLIGLFLILSTFGTLEYNEVAAKLTELSPSNWMLFGITICLFIGATGKSAQIPLFTWLPDAMAGPTPVSALIHAATMVTAGIFLVVRSNFLFETPGAQLTQDIMLYIGLATSLVAAFIAMRQNDIKKVLAYSTVSQLGFIFVALGMGAYTAAIFHVTTHAFFKALLFLGSGSVIHAMSDEQDIRQMGGLKKFIPITHLTFLIGTLAISGFPLLSGFFSKDEILAHALHHNAFIYGALAFSALLTAIYMFRLYFVVFHGEFRGSDHVKSHLHESPLNMTFPLIVLAVLSVVGGALNIPGSHWFSHFLNHNVTGLDKVAELHVDNSSLITLMVTASVLTIVALIGAYSSYVMKKQLPVSDDKITGWAKLSANKLYFDEIYDVLFVKPIELISKLSHQLIEVLFLNNVVLGVAKSIGRTGDLVKKIQTGRTEWYLLWMVFGIIGLVVYYLVKI
ncbi:MAG: NADH-quinone oxidoreductase subunit L [Flavobacteriia bacterium]|nr:NADH-quinone oxidoreductase subunit L [Flavobacteriia bacterium]